MSKSEYRIRIDKLVIIFNSRYSHTFSWMQLLRACKRIGIEIHKVPSKLSKAGYPGRPANAIMTGDVPRLEAEIKSRLPVHTGQGRAAIRRLVGLSMKPVEIARRTGINEGALSQFKNGKKIMNRGQLAKIKKVLKEIEHE